MADILSISKYNKTFVDKVGCKELQDLKKPLSESIKIKEQGFKKKVELTPNSTASFGTKAVYTIPRSYGYVGNMMLYLELSAMTVNANELTYWGCGNYIETVEVKLGTKTVMKYQGTDLPKIYQMVNKGKKDVIEALAQGQNIIVGTTKSLIPIYAPGSNCNFTVDAFDQRKPLWPIGMCNADMTIEIQFRDKSKITKNNDAVLSSAVLIFDAYAIEDNINIGTKSITSNKDSGSVYYSWVGVYPQYYEKDITTLALGTEYTINPDAIIDSGELDFLTLDLVDSTADLGTLYVYNSTCQITKLNVTSGSGELLKFDYIREGNLKTSGLIGCKNVVYNAGKGIGDGSFYVIPCANRIDLGPITGNIGAKGLVLINNKPVIKMTVTSESSFTGNNNGKVRVTAYYKCMYNLKNDGTIDTKTDPNN